MMPGLLDICDGNLSLPDSPGLGLVLDKAIEDAYPYREDAAYACLVAPERVPKESDWEE